MMKHTKGPWVLSPDGIIEDVDGNYVVIFCPEGPYYGRVAMVYAECGRDCELVPNARLIAAAPDLLEALEEIVELMDAVNDGQYAIDSFTTQPAKEAIQKARGK